MNDTSAKFTTDTIGRCAFGLEFNALSDPDSDFMRTGRAVFTPSFRTKMITIIRVVGIGRILDWFRIRGMSDFVYDFFDNLLDTTMKQHESGEIARNDFVSLLVKIKDEEKSKKIDESVYTFYIRLVVALTFKKKDSRDAS